MAKKILVLSDVGESIFSRNLGVLYPGRVTVVDFTKQVPSLEGYDFVVTHILKGSSVHSLDFPSLMEFARRGGQVICSLFEYACYHRFEFRKTYFPGPQCPGIRIRVANDVTRGFSVGDVLPWYGQVSHGIENSPNQFWQRQIMGLTDSDNLTVLATSTVNGGAVIIEEKVGRGRIVAMDIRSLPEPFFDSIGSVNKYLFIGNIVGGSVRYGRYYPRKLTYDEFVETARELSRRHPRVRFNDEGEVSGGYRMFSLSVGKEGAPAFLFTGCVHGWEWEAPYGLLRLVEVLGEDPSVEGLPADGYFVKVFPIANPYGYEHNVRQNANGADLNRNFPCGWEKYESFEDVSMAWDFDYKGPRPASEPETQILMRAFEERRYVATVDFHTAHLAWEVAFPCDAGLVRAINDEVKGRLKDRFICHQHGTRWDEYVQVNLDKVIEMKEEMPTLVSYSATRGTGAPILVELSGNRSGTHAIVRETEVVVQICLGVMKSALSFTSARHADPPEFKGKGSS
jgi:hypothetical protein